MGTWTEDFTWVNHVTTLGPTNLEKVNRAIRDLYSTAGTPGPPGPTGPQGPAGATGAQGPAGVGVPVGGAATYILSKASGADYDTVWVAPPTGSAAAVILAPTTDARNVISGDVAGRVVLAQIASGDTGNRWQVDNSGVMKFGYGSGLPPAALQYWWQSGLPGYRLQLTGSDLAVSGGIYVGGGLAVNVNSLGGNQKQVRVGLTAASNPDNAISMYGGSAWDIQLLRSAAGVLDHGSSSIKGAFRLFGSLAADLLIQHLVTTDTNPRHSVQADGLHAWGPGNAATDTTLYRESAAVLATNSQLHVVNANGIKFNDNTVQTTAAAAGGMTKLVDVTLGSDTASLDSGTFATTYSSIEIQLYLRTALSAGWDNVMVQFNGDTGTSNYEYCFHTNSGTSAPTSTVAGSDKGIQLGLVAAATAPAGDYSPVTIKVPNYANAANYRGVIANSFYGNGNASQSAVWVGGGNWKNTAAAINRAVVSAYSSGALLKAGSRMVIYGYP